MASINSDNSSLSILLVGKTGCGKSATGNTILQEDAFESTFSASSVTKEIKKQLVKYGKQKIEVVDTPGLLDTNLSAEDSLKRFMDEIIKAVCTSPDGYDVILFVCKMNRFTAEDMQVVKQLKATFGEEVFKKHCVIVVTHADDYDQDENYGQKINDWIKKQEGELGNLYKECCGRVVAFDNITKDQSVQNKQIENVLKLTNQIVAENGRYNKDLFEMARKCREQAEAEMGCSFSEEEHKELMLLTREVSKFSVMGDSDVVEKLKSKKAQVASLRDKIVKNDNQTGKLKLLIDNCEIATIIIDQKMIDAQNMSEKTKKFEDETKAMKNEYKKKLNEMRMNSVKEIELYTKSQENNTLYYLQCMTCMMQIFNEFRNMKALQTTTHIEHAYFLNDKKFNEVVRKSLTPKK